MNSIHQELAAQRHISHLLLTDEDIEYGVLFAIMYETDFNEAAHAIFDLKGINDPVLRDLVWKYSDGSGRMSAKWCRVWLEYGYPMKII